MQKPYNLKIREGTPESLVFSYMLQGICECYSRMHTGCTDDFKWSSWSLCRARPFFLQNNVQGQMTTHCFKTREVIQFTKWTQIKVPLPTG